ncbi:MAG TPA: NUDIX domain-containing protein [Kofleriaceae bacterium]|nr:NUDIX domain-containing protein [Kofleriaceae bacterium]
MARDTFCSHCGARFADPSTYPRTCAACGTQTWANPIPVAVALVPVQDEARTGLLVVRRAIPPVGKLALIGGFVEEHESWQACAAREVREEAGVDIDPARLEPLWYASSEPRPNRVLLFALAAPLRAADLPSFVPNTEASERGLIFGPSGIDDLIAFSLHSEAVRRFFAGRSIDGPAGFTAR